MNGFVNVAPGQNRTSNVTTPVIFNPERANQFEVGTKLNLFKDKLYATFSYYDIQVSDQVYVVETPYIDPADPTAELPNNQTSYQDGAQRNKGFEAEFVTNPINGLNIILGYSYNDAVLTKGDPDFVGPRSENAGPRNLANLWASYKFTNGLLRGFGLGFGGNYVGDNMIMNRNVAGTFTIPAYTALNSSLFYNVEKFTITLKLNNITNKEIYDGWSTIHPKDARALIASFSYRF